MSSVFKKFSCFLARFGVLRLRACPNSNKRPETRGRAEPYACLCSYISKSYLLSAGKVKPELYSYSNCDFVTV